MPKFTKIEIESNRVAYSIKLNGVTILSNREQSLPRYEQFVNQWVIDGNNSIEINLSVPPQFKHALEDLYFTCKIYEVEMTGEKPPQQMIKEIKWEYAEGIEFPIVLSDVFSLVLPYSTQLWDNGVALTNETIDMKSLQSFIQDVHYALDSKNYLGIEPLVIAKAKELAHAFYIPVEQRIADQKEFFTMELFPVSGWQMEPINFENMVIDFHADGKLIEVLNRDGYDFLCSKELEDGANFCLPLFLSFQDDDWVICR